MTKCWKWETKQGRARPSLRTRKAQPKKHRIKCGREGARATAQQGLLPLHLANLDLISSSPYGPPNLLGVIPEHRARSEPQV